MSGPPAPPGPHPKADRSTERLRALLEELEATRARLAELRETLHWMRMRDARADQERAERARALEEAERSLRAELAGAVAEREQLERRLEEAERAGRVRAASAASLERELRSAGARERALERAGAEARAALAEAEATARAWEEGFHFVLGSRAWRAAESLRRARRALWPFGAPGRPVPASLRQLVGPPATVPPAAAAPASPPPAGPISFAPAPDPLVTVVVPVHDQIAFTRRCLAALAEHTDHALIEVVAVDDASTDATPAELRRTDGLRVIRNERNAGFLRSCNAGARAARGRHLLFLNNDTEVRPGWLEPLLEALEDEEDVGAVGSKLVYPDGRLQEAGGIIWADGTGWNVGRGGDPDAPEHNFRREVDYCSAASLLVRGDAFARLDGFDERFAPGYYEDVDLAFGLRAAGMRVLYEPRSVVVHHEGASHGTDERAGAGAHTKASQHVNRRAFVAKWSGALAEHWPPGTAGGWRGGRRRARPRVLVVDDWLPAHDRDAGGHRMSWILWLLRDLGCEVTLVSAFGPRREPYASDFEHRGIEVRAGAGEFGAFAETRAGTYDVVVLSRRHVAAAHMETVRRHFPGALLVFDTVDLHFVREERELALTGELTRHEAAAAREDELRCARLADLTVTVTEDEAAVIGAHVPGARLAVIPTIHEPVARAVPGFAERRDLLFIGSFGHPPNLDGLIWFLESVFPRLRASINARLIVIGPMPPEGLVALQSPNLVVTGYVPDVDPYFDGARVFVSPLRYGAGMKGKNGQAMSYGLPLVTTSIGAEGMDLEDGRTALIRDDAEGFAAAVERLYRDRELWEEISRVGHEQVARLWSPAVVRARLEAIVSGHPHEAAGGAPHHEAAAGARAPV